MAERVDGGAASSRRSRSPGRTAWRHRPCPTPPTHADRSADGVYVWLQPGGETGVANAGVVVDDDGLTVIDTLMVRSQWEPFAAAVVAPGSTGPPHLLTHAHIDHVGGTKAFPNAAVYGTPVTSDALEQAMPIDGYKQFMPAFDRGVRRPRRGRHRAGHPSGRRRRAAHAPHRGPPRAGPHRGRPRGARVGCRRVLRRRSLLLRRDPTRLPGRSRDVGRRARRGGGARRRDRARTRTGRRRSARCRELQAYLRQCVAAEGDVAAIPNGPWDAWLDRDRDAINVERAALLARGDDAMPPSMLKAIGLG